jgi:hypothetical protein
MQSGHKGGKASVQAQSNAFPRLALSPLPVNMAPAKDKQKSFALGSQSVEVPFGARPRLATMTGDFSAPISAFSLPPPPPSSKLEVRRETATFAKPMPKRAEPSSSGSTAGLPPWYDQENVPTHAAATRQYGKLRAGSQSRAPLQLRGAESAYEAMGATHAAVKASAIVPFSAVRTAHRSSHRQSKKTTALREHTDESDDEPGQDAEVDEAEEPKVEKVDSSRVLRKPKRKIDYRLDAPSVLESYSGAYIDESTPVQSKRAGHKRKTRATPVVPMTTALKQAKDWASNLDSMAPSEFEVTAKKKARQSSGS